MSLSIDTEVGIVSPMRLILALELDSKFKTIQFIIAKLTLGVVWCSYSKMNGLIVYAFTDVC